MALSETEVDSVGRLEGLVVDGRYLVETELGRGAMGIVYRARHVEINRPVALKVLHRHLLNTPTMIERFEREAELAGKLHHPNVVPVLDLGELADGRRSMVLELVIGDSLATVMNAPISPTRAMVLLRQLCDGLDHAHRLGLIHRDLKPENIVVEQRADGREVPRIVDFGLAILHDNDSTERLTQAGIVLGTPAYMAPEQAIGRPLDRRADLYSLGVIAFEMLAGTRPFVGSSVEVVNAHVAKPPPTIESRSRSGWGYAIDPLLEGVVRKLLAKKPADRFATAREVREVLDLIDRDRAKAAALIGLTIDSVSGPAAGPIEPIEAIEGPPMVTAVARLVSTTPGVPARKPVATRRPWLPIGVITVAVAAMLAIVAGAL